MSRPAHHPCVFVSLEPLCVADTANRATISEKFTFNALTHSDWIKGMFAVTSTLFFFLSSMSKQQSLREENEPVVVATAVTENETNQLLFLLKFQEVASAGVLCYTLVIA